MTRQQLNTTIEEFRKDQFKVDKYDHAGIYCIKINGQIVYIGKSFNMLERIASHYLEIAEGTSKSNKYKVLHNAYNCEECFLQFDVLYNCRRVRPEAVEKELGNAEAKYINKYMPALNYQIPKIGDYKHYTVNKKAQIITLEEILGKEVFIF